MAALVVWVLAVGITALAGGFHATAQDNSEGVFFFTAVPPLFWVVLVVFGVAIRRAASGKWRG
jgi:hypothetical protein